MNREMVAAGHELGASKPIDGDIVECSLLLLHQELAALEEVAHGRGLTAGQMLRHVIRDFLGRSERPWPVEPGRFHAPRRPGS